MTIRLTTLIPRLFFLLSVWIWGSVVFFSLIHHLQPLSVWISTVLFLLLLCSRLKGKTILFPTVKTKTVAIVVALFGLTFVQGFVSAPNTTDSMIYHLPRVIYWIQEKTIFQDRIVTSHDFMPGLAESMVMWTMLLSGGDRFAFLPQWIAGIVAVVTMTLIAEQLGVSRRQTQTVSLLTATFPMLLLQSASTQTDLVLGAFVLITVYLALQRSLFLLAIAMALALLAKPTALVFFCIPVLILIPTLPTLVRSHLRTLIVGALCAGLILLPFVASNFKLFHSISGRHATSDGRTLIYTNEGMNPALLFSNIQRNILIQVPLPVVGRWVTPLIANDPRTTWYGSTFIASSVFIPQEDIASAPIHVFLIAVSTITIWKMKLAAEQKRVVVGTVLSFVLFCALLKWQPYNPRLEIAFVLLLMPVASMSLDRFMNLRKIVLGMSLLLGLLTIIANTSHPFFSYDLIFSKLKAFAPQGQQPPQSIFIQPREQQYFAARPYWYEPYKQVVEQLHAKGISKVNIDLFDEFTYPLMRQLRHENVSVSQKAKTLVNSRSEDEPAASTTTCYSTTIKYGRICIE